MKRRMKRLEELSSSSLTLDEVDEVNQNESMWRICGEVLMKLLTGWGKELPVSKSEKDSCTIQICSWRQATNTNFRHHLKR